jgi:hypothetical protein
MMGLNIYNLSKSDFIDKILRIELEINEVFFYFFIYDFSILTRIDSFCCLLNERVKRKKAFFKIK